MPKKFKRVPLPNGKFRIVPTDADDSNGKERWELYNKWSSKPGRKPTGDAVRENIHVKLPPDLAAWLRDQPEGVTATVEEAVILLREKNNNNIISKRAG